MSTSKNHMKEIQTEIDYGSDKIRLILQFPPEQPALQQEIRTILSRELLNQTQCCQKTFP